jgi:integrase
MVQSNGGVEVNLFQRGKTWYADVVIDGKRERPSLNTTDQSEALRRLADLLQKRGTPATAAAGINGMTVGQALDRMWTTVWSKMRDENKQSLLRAVASQIGEGTPLASIDRRVLKELQEKLLEQGKSPARVNRYLNVLTKTMREARDEWELDIRVPSLKRMRESKGRVRYLSDEEIGLVLDAERDPVWRTFWLFLLDSGARLSDGLLTRWDQFDWQNRMWLSPNSKTGVPVNLPLQQETIDALKVLKDDGRYRPFPLTDYAAIAHFRRTRTRAGLDKTVTIHTLRHTCATHLLARGADIREVQVWLGHANIATTMRYTKVMPASLMKLRDQREYVPPHCD